jgi:hypothetical protein
MMNQTESKIMCLLCLIALLIIPNIYIADAVAPVAEKPIYTKGDSWLFVNRNKFKKRKHIFQKEEKDKYVFKIGKSDRTSYIYFTSKIKGTLTGYRNPIIDFPITVGKKWDHKYKRESQVGGKKTDIIRASHKVVAYESVTVPAGTFQAFKINVVCEAADSRRMITNPEKIYFWYAPEVKQLVKKIRGNLDTWELKKYKIK